MRHSLHAHRLLASKCVLLAACTQGRDPAHQGRQPGHHPPGGVQRSRKECNFLSSSSPDAYMHSSDNYSWLACCLRVLWFDPSLYNVSMDTATACVWCWLLAPAGCGLWLALYVPLACCPTGTASYRRYVQLAFVFSICFQVLGRTLLMCCIAFLWFVFKISGPISHTSTSASCRTRASRRPSRLRYQSWHWNPNNSMYILYALKSSLDTLTEFRASSSNTILPRMLLLSFFLLYEVL